MAAGQLGQCLTKIPVGGEVGICANALADFHADSGHRIIVATATNGNGWRPPTTTSLTDPAAYDAWAPHDCCPGSER